MTPNRFDVDKYYYPKAPLLPALLYALCYFLFYYLVRTLIYRCAYIYFLSASAGDLEAAAEMYYESANMIAFLSGIIILAFLAVFFSFRKKNLSQAFHLNKTRASTALICFFTGIFLNFMTTLIISYLPESLLESYSDASSGAMQGHTVWYILAAVIMAPILEEVIFRAMMLSHISTATGNVIAIILSSVIFGVVHGHIVWSTYAFVLGAFLGTVFVRTRSVKASIITHFGFNLVSLLSYIDIESVPQTYQMLYQTLLSLCYSLSVPISIAFIIILFHETADTASRMPVGFNEE